MTRTASPLTSSTRRRRRPRVAADGDLFGALAREEQAARQLAEDLAALIQAGGLIAPTDVRGELRFPVVEPDRDAS